MDRQHTGEGIDVSERQTGPGADRPRGVRDTARGEVLHRHARLTKKGRPVFCSPSRAELRGAAIPRQSRGTDGKVIYPTRESAEAAARELESLGCRYLRAYLCGRSRGGHFHLATDSAGRTLHERIPQQRIPQQRIPQQRIPQQRHPLSA